MWVGFVRWGDEMRWGVEGEKGGVYYGKGLGGGLYLFPMLFVYHVWYLVLVQSL